jgi:hypothetical protein
VVRRDSGDDCSVRSNALAEVVAASTCVCTTLAPGRGGGAGVRLEADGAGGARC